MIGDDDALEAMPAFVERAARELGEAAARRKPSGGAFSLVEHAWHLADLEREGFGERIERLLHETEPQLADFDGDRAARERRYVTLPLDEALAAFRRARAQNLRALRSLPASDWSRGGTQEGVGRVTLRDLPRLMAEHDDSHRREIEDLLARR